MGRLRISSYFAGALLMLAVLVAFVVQYSVNHLVRAGAEASGTQWVTYLRESTPQLDKYLKIGALHPAQKFSLGSISLGPALIRFTIFDAHGAPLLSRDEEFQQFAPEFEVPNAIAQRVIETGDAIALLERGGQEEGLPDFYSITYAPIFDAEGGVIGVIKVFVDQTEIAAFYGRVFYWLAGGLTVLCCTVFALPSYAFLRQKEAAVTARKRAEFLVRHDVMTGLLNRAAFMEAFHGWGAVGDRVIGFLDCDRFKQINDTMGHEAGDVFLCHVAARLTECLPEDALIARFGGDEFVVGLRDLDYRKARDVLVRAQTAVANPVLEEERQISGTVSIGLSFAGEGAGTDALLQEADAALYAAKAAGGNCVRLFPGKGKPDAHRARDLPL
ncbi:MAG: diguanylate cyclase, partial [Pseudomonadota bacterium]